MSNQEERKCLVDRRYKFPDHMVEKWLDDIAHERATISQIAQRNNSSSHVIGLRIKRYKDEHAV